MRRPFILVLTLALAASVLGLLSVSASAVPPGDTADTGNLYTDPASFSEGQSVKLTANFPNGVFTVTFYKQTAPDTWTSIGVDESNSYGNAYLTSYQVNGTQDVYARITGGGDGRTEVKTLTPLPPDAIAPTGPDTGNLTQSPTTFKAGDLISVTANFPNGTFPITLYKEGPADTWTAVATKTSSSSGNATFSGFAVTAATQRIFARKANNDRTEVDDIKPTPTVTLSIRRDCPTNACGLSATAYGALDPVQQGRTFKLQRLSGSTWSTVGNNATTGPDGKLQIPFSLGGLSQWSARSYRLVTADATTPALTSNTIQFMPGPTQLGKNVLRVDVDKGVFPTILGPKYTGKATLSVDGVVNPKLDHVALEKFGVRGKSSAKFPKKPYSLKFDKSPKDTTVFGMGADKSWTLLPNFIDQTFIRDKVGLDLGRRMANIPWTPDSRFVEVFVNDQYRGLYTMTESVKIDNDRVDVDADTGMIMETDGADPEDPSIGFISTIGKIAFSFKDPDERKTLPDGTPDPESVTDAKMTLIKDRVNAFESTIYSSSTREQYPDWIDVEAAAEFYLLKEFTRDNDTDFYNSHYFSWDSVLDPLKPLADRKFHFGPAWDFDRSAGNVSDTDAHSKYVSSPVGWSMRGTGTPSGRPYYSTHWFVQLFKTTTFKAAVEDRWLELRDEFEKVHLSETAALKAAIGVSAESDRKRWASEPKRYASRGTYDQEIAYVTKWYKDRYTWMDGQLSN